MIKKIVNSGERVIILSGDFVQGMVIDAHL
jgi:hypothetical protein